MYLSYELQFDQGVMCEIKKDTIYLKQKDVVIPFKANEVGVTCFPILKPMAAFDEDQKIKCISETMGETHGEPCPLTTIHSRQVIWLLENHYDIFGLIPAGYAKTYE